MGFPLCARRWEARSGQSEPPAPQFTSPVAYLSTGLSACADPVPTVSLVGALAGELPHHADDADQQSRSCKPDLPSFWPGPLLRGLPPVCLRHCFLLLFQVP